MSTATATTDLSQDESTVLASQAMDTLRSAQVDTAAARGDMFGRGSYLYSVILGLIVFAFMGWSVLAEAGRQPSPAPFIADSGFLATGATALGIGVIITIATITGPLGAGRAMRSWLLSSPADRAVLLRGMLLTITLGLGLFGAATGSFVEALRQSPPVVLAASAVAWFAASVVIVLIVAITQGRPARRAIARFAGPAAVGVGSLTLVLGVAPGWSAVMVLRARPDEASVVQLAISLITLIACLIAVVRLWPRVRVTARRLGISELARGGDIIDALGVSTLMLDSTPIRAVLTASRVTRRDLPRTTRRLTGVWALAELDAARIRRHSPELLVVATTIPLAATVTALFGRTGGSWMALLLGYLVVYGFSGALVTWTRSPSLRRHLPFAAWQARLALLACPLTAGLLWLLPALALARVDLCQLPAMLIAIASGVLRASEVKDTSTAAAGMVSGPMGAIPVGLLLLAARGFDMLILPGLLLTAGSAWLALAAAGIVFAYLLLRPVRS